MSNTLSNPKLVLVNRKSVPSIEVDNDEIEGKYEGGEWECLVSPFTTDWVKRKKFLKSATIWMVSSLSVSFHHTGYSVFIAQFGLPMSYFEALQRHLAVELRDKVRFSDSVQPSLGSRWRARIHVQDGATWIPEDAITWSAIER